MLKTGTRVYINPIPYANYDKRPAGYEFDCDDEMEFMNKYGQITSEYDDEYYFVKLEREKQYLYHKSELIDMEIYKPIYKNGDKVIIQSITENEKDIYPPEWVPEMDDYIGETVTITEIINRPNFYRVAENEYVWHSSNLTPLTNYDAF